MAMFHFNVSCDVLDELVGQKDSQCKTCLSSGLSSSQPHVHFCKEMDVN